MKAVVFGNGWLGNKFAARFGTIPLHVDILDYYSIVDALSKSDAPWVVNAAGKCGTPNIDWCDANDANRKATTYSNAYGPAIIERACLDMGKRFLHLSSGCIWESGKGIVETDTPNPNSFYAHTKVEGEKRLVGDNTLILRLRMPFDGTRSPRNLIMKLASYPFVLNVQNSLTCIDDLLNAAEHLMKKQLTGTFHVVNAGTMSGKDVMEMYQEIVQPDHRFTPTTMKELTERGLIRTGRSNVVLSTQLLEKAGFVMPQAKESMLRCMRQLKETQ